MRELEAQLAGIVGEGGLQQGGGSEYSVDGVVPGLVAFPESAAQVAELVKVANANGLKVVPYGGGTAMGLGMTPERVDLVLSTKRLTDTPHDDRRDMTLSVGAGMTLSALNARLAEDNLWLPLDPPDPERATIGGLVAADQSGPLRHGLGTLRDHVIGMKVISAEGKLVAAGGRVVRNVAGYDMCKLHIGALGTLGLLVEVSLKLAARPQANAIVLAKLSSVADAEPLIAAVLDSSLEPVLLELVFGTACGAATAGLLPDGAVVAAGFAGNGQRVAWQAEAFAALVASQSLQLLASRSGNEAQTAREALAEVHGGDSADVVLVASVLSSQVAELLTRAAALSEPRGVAMGAASHAGKGLARLFLRGEEQALTEVTHAAREVVVERGGSVIVAKAPPKLKPLLNVWGAPAGDLAVLQAVRRTYDPNETLNAYRHATAVRGAA